MSASPQMSKVPGAQPAAERRRSPRRPIVDEQIMAVTLDGDNGGLVLDLAENGLAVQAVTPLQPGKATEMAFVLGESRVPIRAHGIVRWAEPSGRAGIRLLAFSEGSSADIRAALLQPAIPPVVEPPARPLVDPAPILDADSLEQEITSRGLDREPALAYVAERARELASAGGIAIALGSRQEMICRASAGAAPPVGVRLQSDAGLSGECVRTGLLVRCDDTQADARVDAAVCRQLDLRSAVLVPVLDAGEMRGVLEVFSSRPHAFAAEDIRRFEQVAGLVARIMREPAVPPLPAEPVRRVAAPPAAVIATRAATPAPARETRIDTASDVVEEVSSASPASAFTSPALTFGVAVGGVIVLALASWAFLHHRQTVRSTVVAASVPAAAPAATPVELAPQPVPVVPMATEPERPRTSPKAERPLAAREELALRELPSAAPSAQPEAVAPPTMTLATGPLPDLAAPASQPARPRQSGGVVVAGRLLQRVDPVYPELARRAHIGGTVVLNAVIRPDGKVGSVEVASGNPLLARAAADAVRQWRYEPFRLNGSAVQAAATIRLNFNPNLGPQSGH